MCDVCLKYKCPPQCPNYKPPTSSIKCSACGEYIYDGEEYIVNQDGNYRHCDCYFSVKELIEWLGHEVNTMEIDDYYDN